MNYNGIFGNYQISKKLLKCLELKASNRWQLETKILTIAQENYQKLSLNDH